MLWAPCADFFWKKASPFKSINILDPLAVSVATISVEATAIINNARVIRLIVRSVFTFHGANVINPSQSLII